VKLAAFSVPTSLGENPLDDLKDKHYRLFSSITIRVITDPSGNIVTIGQAGPMRTDTGQEGFLQAPPLQVSRVSAIPTAKGRTFSWFGKGCPNPLVEPGFQFVCPRTSRFIWHQVFVDVEPAGSTLSVSVSLSGSHFPSHRIYVDGAIKSTIPQGVFSDLWTPSSSDPTVVA
jgi:hypothetical protein